jgi:hypothetical protein
MASLAEAVAQGKTGIADLLATTDGLRPADEVTVSSGPVEPLPSRDMIILGEVTTPQSRPGLATREGRPTMNGWVIVSRPEGGEAAIREARAVASRYMGLIEAAIRADPTAAGTITPPGGTRVASSGLQESPADWNGQAVRQATIPFSVSWTSHIT